ncbi:MAG: hypothetical protein EBX35_11605 [Planctomycetia bacterium]|nr:hypothetical protein [Planctomycetia bacterium]
MAIQISEDWLAPQERLDVQAEFSSMVGGTLGARLTCQPFPIRRPSMPPAASGAMGSAASRPTTPPPYTSLPTVP